MNRANRCLQKTTKFVVIEKPPLSCNNFSNNFSITLKDVDTSVMTHVKNVMKPRIKEANETFKIPVYYGNEERWRNFRKRGVLRDKNNSLILTINYV